MDDPSPVRPRYSQQLRISDARPTDFPSRSHCGTVFRMPGARSLAPPPMKRESGVLRISDDWFVPRPDERNDNLMDEGLEKRLTVNTAANTDMNKGYIPDINSCHQAQMNRYDKNCPACCKLKKFQELQKLRLRPPCKQKCGQKRGISKRSSRLKKKCRGQPSRRKKRYGNAVRPCKSRPKTNKKFLRGKDSAVGSDCNTDSGSNISSSAYISSQEKIPSAANSVPDHEPMDV